MPTARLERFIVSTGYEDIPPKITEVAKRCLLYWLGSAYAGSGAPSSQVLRDILDETGGRPEATVIGSLRRGTCLHAALANGSSGYLVETDDPHPEPIVTPVGPVIPAALAMAERQGKSGKDLLRAIVLGYEAFTRVGRAMGSSSEWYGKTNGSAHTLGAAVAAGVLLDLRVEEMVRLLEHAIPHSYDQPELPVVGVRSDHLAAGRAATYGILHALLVKKGYWGRPTSERGNGCDQGLSKSLFDSKSIDLIEAGSNVGEDWGIASAWHKSYASSRHTHSAIDAALDIVRKFDLTEEDVEGITVRTYQNAIDLLGDPAPSSPHAARFSLPYCIACAVLFRSVALDRFTDEALSDQRLRRFMDKVNMVADPSLEGSYPAKWPAVVRIATTSAMKLVANVDFPKGHPRNPLSPEDLSNKFKELCLPTLGTSQVDDILERVWNLDRQSDLNGLLVHRS